MEYLYKVLGIKATVQRAEFDHLPNYIAVRYRLQKVSMDGQKVIFLYPKTELEQIKDLKVSSNPPATPSSQSAPSRTTSGASAYR